MAATTYPPCPAIVFRNITEIVEQNEDIVNFLLTYHFDSFSNNDKHFVKSLSRPTPRLKRLINTSSRGSNRLFSTAWYERYFWLTGSETRNKLFCWPCLLYSEEAHNSVWGRLGYDNMKELSRALQKHANSKDHLSCELRFKIFGKQNIPNGINSKYNVSIKKHNEKVSHNRAILKRLVDVVIFSGSQEPITDSRNFIDEGNKGLLKILEKYEPKLKENFFKGLLPVDCYLEDIEDELIASVCHVVRSHIEAEILKSEFFSWQLDGSTNKSGSSLLSVIFRYCVDGVPVERFFEFLEVTAGRDANEMFQLLTVRNQKFNIPGKLIGHTYDGASMKRGQMHGLQMKFKTYAPMALLTHSHAHNLNLILQDACMQIKECRIFFANLNGVSDFFVKSRKRIDLLDSLCPGILPSGSGKSWPPKSEAVSTILKHRKGLVSVFEHIIESDEFYADREMVQEAIICRKQLTDVNFVLLLRIFELIFSQADTVNIVIQNRKSSFLFSESSILQLISSLKSYMSYKHYFKKTAEETMKDLDYTQKELKPGYDHVVEMTDCSRIFNSIMNLCLHQIKTRFSNVHNLVFFELLNRDDFIDYQSTFPKKQLEVLIKAFPHTVENR
ncbi:unnamed protein product [Phaedon cochleariae]|uniref:TTF-type domain-containing protein n=1 Tax=Phaedon cochleariae TaxID=80249 RepID=A0A9N9X5I3_PHACE|nr:unnamed protein product [Phaedon cochleariae]